MGGTEAKPIFTTGTASADPEPARALLVRWVPVGPQALGFTLQVPRHRHHQELPKLFGPRGQVFLWHPTTRLTLGLRIRQRGPLTAPLPGLSTIDLRGAAYASLI